MANPFDNMPQSQPQLDTYVAAQQLAQRMNPFSGYYQTNVVPIGQANYPGARSYQDVVNEQGYAGLAGGGAQYGGSAQYGNPASIPSEYYKRPY